MNPNNRPKAEQLIDAVTKKALANHCGTETRTIRHNAGNWEQLRVYDLHPGLHNGIFLLTAGIHGTEIAGPFSFYYRLPQILACTRVAGLQLVGYPLINPIGYDNGTDHSIDGGDYAHNNNFVSSQMPDGSWTWQLPDDCRGRCWSSDPIVGQRLPAETAVMHEFLKKENWPNTKVVVDMHQDNLTPGMPAGAYHYPFGDLSRYNGIIDKIRELTTILGNRDFRFSRDDPNDVVRSDQNGCIVFHDGTLGDLACWKGVPHALTVETTGATELQTAIEVNITWIRGLCELVKNGQ